MGMKKTPIIIGVILASLTLSPAHAAEQKSLAIIDSYFDNASVCVATSGCNLNIVSKANSLSDPSNHGNAMVEVAKRQSSTIKIITIRSANATAKTVNEMSTGDFIRALQWVNSNYNNIGAVSISRYFNSVDKTKTCYPNVSGTAEFGGVAKADTTIRTLISSLNSKGIKLFASTGNTMGANVDYPACISDTNSVSVGNKNKLGQIVSLYAFDANTDYFADGAVYSYKSNLLGLIPNTTSAGNVAVAAKFVSGTLDAKFVNVLQ
jgi:hypothetical protein